MVESVFEDLKIKKDLFNQMGEICKQRAIPADQVLLCSNTMSLFLGSITEDMCKEYRGSCIGMRFLHPVWFIDEVRGHSVHAATHQPNAHVARVGTFHSRAGLTPGRACRLGLRVYDLQVELTDCDYTRRTTSSAAEKLLKQLFFQPFFYDGCYRRRLTLQEISTYQSRQRLRCPEPIKTPLNKKGLRKKLGSSSPDRSSSEMPAGSSDKEEAPSSEPEPGAPEPEEAEPCAVCLEEPRCALLVPCGHVAMCVDCAEKVLHSSRAVCVVCRQPIEKILRAAPP